MKGIKLVVKFILVLSLSVIIMLKSRGDTFPQATVYSSFQIVVATSTRFPIFFFLIAKYSGLRTLLGKLVC